MKADEMESVSCMMVDIQTVDNVVARLWTLAGRLEKGAEILKEKGYRKDEAEMRGELAEVREEVWRLRGVGLRLRERLKAVDEEIFRGGLGRQGCSR